MIKTLFVPIHRLDHGQPPGASGMATWAQDMILRHGNHGGSDPGIDCAIRALNRFGFPGSRLA